MANLLLRFLVVALTAAVFMLALPSASEALNMGTLQKSYGASVNPGDVAAFTLLFWNTDGAPYNVSISAGYAPDGWMVIASPKEFSIDSNPSGKTEYIYLPYLKKSIGAKVIEIYVQAPETAAAGKYSVMVDARAGKSVDVPVSLVGQKRFAFDITVSGGRVTREVSGFSNRTVIIENPGISEIVSENEGNGVVASEQQHPKSNKALLVAAGVVLVIAWGIYRL